MNQNQMLTKDEKDILSIFCHDVAVEITKIQEKYEREAERSALQFVLKGEPDYKDDAFRKNHDREVLQMAVDIMFTIRANMYTSGIKPR